MSAIDSYEGGLGLPFSTLSEQEKSKVKYIITDVDDTITRRGKLTPEALKALWDLKFAGKTIVLLTGGSAGWADCYIRQWPVDVVIAESGAVMMGHKGDGSIIYTVNPLIKQPEANEKRQKLLKATAGVPLSSDQYARLFDVAYDKAKLTLEEKHILENTIKMSGAYYSESSIHINAWFAPYDKLSALLHFMKSLYNVDESTLRRESVYLGDSYNDQPMFASIPLSVGMHFIEDHRAEFKFLPKYITEGEGGVGFAEFARELLRK